MKRKLKNLLSITLCLIMVCGVMPFAFVSYSTSTVKSIQLNTGSIKGYNTSSGYDFIYYGKWNDSSIKWRVLDTKTNMANAKSGDGLFLLSDTLLGTGKYGGVYFDNSRDTKNNKWQGSDAQKWCKDFAGESGAETNVADAFSIAELAAIKATSKSDAAFTGTSSGSSVNFSASGNILNGDKVFFLSAEEAEKTAYGFTDNSARVAYYNGSAKTWWLRSPVTDKDSYAGAVNGSGKAFAFGIKYDWAARPAFNLDSSKILFISAAKNGKTGDGLTEVPSYSGNEWKLTLKDESRQFAVSTDSVSATTSGGNVSIKYSGAKTGTNEYVSALLMSGSTVLYYGRIVANSASGTANVQIPAGLTEGKYTIKVFSEQYNGDYNTDYASSFKDVTLTVHTPASAVKENEIASACTKAGSYDSVVYCSVCGDEISRETVPVAATGHTPKDAVKENVVASTCTKAGSYDSVVYCSVCGDEISRKTIPTGATGHRTSSAVTENEVAPTCTKSGSCDSVVYCSVCGDEISRETVTVPKTAHTPSEAVKENEIAPTCTAAGSYDSVIYCSVCHNEISKETVTVPATGHSFTNYVSDKNATCTKNGTETAKCDNCDATDTREIADSALGHTPKEAVKEKVVAPTCTEGGSYESVIYCSVCGDEISRETISVPATGHIDENGDGRCDVCGTVTDEDLANPCRNALIEVPSDETIGWKFRATMMAEATNIPEGYHIAWYEGDTKVSDSAKYTTGSLTEAHTYTAKIVDPNGNVASSDSQNKSVTVTVRKGIFNMIISFFLRLFGRNTITLGGPFIFTGC